MTDFTDNKFFAQSDGPCVMIDSNSYKKLKEQAHKNQQDIEEKAKMKYQEYLGKNDINVTFKIPSLNLIDMVLLKDLQMTLKLILKIGEKM